MIAPSVHHWIALDIKHAMEHPLLKLAANMVLAMLPRVRVKVAYTVTYASATTGNTYGKNN